VFKNISKFLTIFGPNLIIINVLAIPIYIISIKKREREAVK